MDESCDSFSFNNENKVIFFVIQGSPPECRKLFQGNSRNRKNNPFD